MPRGGGGDKQLLVSDVVGCRRHYWQWGAEPEQLEKVAESLDLPWDWCELEQIDHVNLGGLLQALMGVYSL